jgi:hypothetical protein
MDIAMLVLAAICGICSVITTVPVVSGWLSQNAGASQKNPKKGRWLLVLGLSTFALIFSGVGLYRTIHYGDYKKWQSPKQEAVYERSFVNETVEVDGKLFDRCHFENVKLLYHGRGPVSFNDSELKGSVMFGSDNIAINQFMITKTSLDQNKGLFQLHSWVQMDSNGNPISIQ